jgi:hypothetical protein
MIKLLRDIILGISVLILSLPAYGQEKTREQLKGPDEKVQEIKNDVLSIAPELNQIEEKLTYPSNPQMAEFVSVARGETVRLDSVEVLLEGTPVAHHISTSKVSKDVGPETVEFGLSAHDIRLNALFDIRRLDLPNVQDRLGGVLLGIYRHLGNKIKLGVGYNFSDFSDDLTQLDYRHHGFVISLIGKM